MSNTVYHGAHKSCRGGQWQCALFKVIVLTPSVQWVRAALPMCNGFLVDSFFIILLYLNIDSYAHVSQLAGVIISRPWCILSPPPPTHEGSVTHAWVNRWQKHSGVARRGSCEVVSHDNEWCHTSLRSSPFSKARDRTNSVPSVSMQSTIRDRWSTAPVPIASLCSKKKKKKKKTQRK